jgi:hypothetical protein
MGDVLVKEAFVVVYREKNTGCISRSRDERFGDVEGTGRREVLAGQNDLIRGESCR